MNDKLMILKMLEDGKISADEACRLLEAIESASKKESKGNGNCKSEERQEKQGFVFEEDFAKKVESAARDIAGATKKFTEKMFGQINSTISSVENRFAIVEKRLYPLDELASSYDIVIRTSGHSVNIIPCFSNNISLEVESKSLQKVNSLDDYISFQKLTSSCELLINLPDKSWGKLDIQLPRNVKKLIVETQNAKCCIQDVICEDIRALSSNAKIELNHCKADRASLNTDNAKIVATECRLNLGIFKTNNGRIELIDSSINNIDCETCNAPIYLNDVQMFTEGEGSYLLNTSNSQITAVLGTSFPCAFAVDAHTSVGNINVQLDDISYTEEKMPNLASKLSAESINYADSPSRLLVNARTSNADISIGK